MAIGERLVLSPESARSLGRNGVGVVFCDRLFKEMALKWVMICFTVMFSTA
jgi:hypothetical protein